MSRRGFALLTCLWLVVALSAAGAAALATARVGSIISRNRVLLTRAGWAREACAEILLARFAERAVVAGLDTTEISRGAWCRVAVEDAAGKLDLNRATREMLLSILGNDSLTDAVLDWRDQDEVAREFGVEAEWYRSQGQRVPRNGPLADIGELSLVRGFDPARVARLQGLLTVRGAETIDLNAAPEAVLTALPGFGREAVALALRRRDREQRIGDSDELLSLLSTEARQTLLARFREFSLHAGYRPSRIVVRVEGGVRGAGLLSAIRLTVVPGPGRLAVIRRETE